MFINITTYLSNVMLHVINKDTSNKTRNKLHYTKIFLKISEFLARQSVCEKIFNFESQT